MSETPATPPPGWYEDPAGSEQQRRWDGVQWTHDLRDPPSTHAEAPPPAEPEEASGVLEISGYGAVVTFDGKAVMIRRRRLGRLTVGKGEKHIPLRNITAIQFKKAGPLVNGYIQFTVGGGNESRAAFGRQTFDAVKDENSVIFTYSQRKVFEAFRDTIQEAMSNYGTDATAPAPAPAPASPRDPDIPEQIKALGELRDSGHLTDEEFATKKAELLRRM